MQIYTADHYGARNNERTAPACWCGVGAALARSSLVQEASVLLRDWSHHAINLFHFIYFYMPRRFRIVRVIINKVVKMQIDKKNRDVVYESIIITISITHF